VIATPSGTEFFEDFGVWKKAPILTGSTKFEPLPDVKNIMITGGAGFMYDIPTSWPRVKSILLMNLLTVPAGWYDT
jgi:hypothetical protein